MRVLIMLLCYLAQDPVGALVPPRMMDTTNSASRLWLSSSAAGSAGTRRSEPAAARGADTVLPWNRTNRLKSMTAVVAGFLSGASALDPSALADTEVELADLPPPFVPVLFGLGLLVGVGLLTGSLGDVLDEESQLGLQSGARAKKDIDRSRSSYFKKK